MGLVEALGAVPGEVRVAEHHARARWRSPRRRARRRSSRCRAGRSPRPRPTRSPRPSARWPASASAARAGARSRRRVGDPLDRDPGAGEAAELVKAPVDVDLADRAHPLRAAAARVRDPVDPGLAQVGVVAGDVAAHDLPQRRRRSLGRRSRDQVLDDPRPVDPLVEEVGGEVVVDRAVAGELPALVGAEVARALGARRSRRRRRSCRCCPRRRRRRSRSRAQRKSAGGDVRDAVRVRRIVARSGLPLPAACAAGPERSPRRWRRRARRRPRSPPRAPA